MADTVVDPEGGDNSNEMWWRVKSWTWDDQTVDVRVDILVSVPDKALTAAVEAAAEAAGVTLEPFTPAGTTTRKRKGRG